MPKLIFLLFLATASANTLAQNTLPEKIVAALDSFTLIRPQEKAYVQTDRNSYIAGETVWFKTYALLHDKATILSKIIYVVLLNPDGKVIEKQMLKLNDGTANGSIELKREMVSGDYYLRCYTMWMLNFPEFITEKKLTVSNYGKTASIKNRAARSINISFFPEGGDLVAGLKTKIAFKALTESGAPVSVSGYITNSKNESLFTFNSIHDGMGLFELQPEANENYTAVLKLSDGTLIKKTLPPVKAEGIILTVDNTNLNKTFIKVERSEKSNERYNSLLVLAQLNYQVVYLARLNIDEGLDAAAVNKKNLPPGLMQVTVLTEEGQPLAERIVFVANHNISNDLLQGSLTNVEKRGKNILVLEAGDFLNLQAAVSVTNADAEQKKYTDNIVSALLLSADIKGTVNEPGYYFKDKDAGTLKNLDLLMMVNGWRRFTMQHIMSNKYSPLHYPFETGLSITGKVMQSNNKSALKGGRVSLMIKGEDSTNLLSQANTNETSVFVVPDIDFKKMATVYYQGTNTNKTDALVSVTIDSAYFDTLHQAVINTPGFNTETLTALMQQMLNEKQKNDSTTGKLLREIVLRSKKISQTDSLNQLYASDIFYNSDQTLALNPNITYYDVWQFLRMTVPGIIINPTDSGVDVKFSRYEGLDMFSANGNSSVQFFLNEVPVNISFIESLDPSDVAMVKIFKGVTGIALGATRGAIAFYTVKGRSGRDWRQKGFDFFTKSGYSVSRAFYEMDYSTINPETKLSDSRTTLYWNPELKVKNGKATIEFYNDDVCKKFRIVIEGMDANGKLLHVEKEIQ